MSDLRKSAEDILKHKRQNTNELSHFEMQKLIEELQVHQIELQLQNEELIESRQENEIARKKYFNLFELAPAGYLIVNEQAIILETNLRATEIFGRRKEHLFNHPFVSVLESESMSKFYEYFEYAKTKAIFDPFELIISKNNEKRTIELSFAYYLNNNYLVVISDITSRKYSEKQRLESEQKFQNLFEHANDAIFIAVANTGIIVDANKRAEELLGKDRNEIIGMHQTKLHPPQDEIVIRNSFQHDLDAKNSIKFKEFFVIHKNGNKIPVEISPSIVEVDGIKYVFSIFRDISERQIVQQQLAENEEKFRRLVERSPNIIYSYSMINGGMFYSKRVEEILGYSVEHLKTNPNLWKESIHKTDLPKVELAIQNAISGSDFEIEYRIKDVNGNWRWFYDKLIGVTTKGDDNFIEGIAVDISKLKQTEFELQELNATKDKFFSIIAHDLRNPFNTILGFSELLAKNTSQMKTEKIVKFAENIYQSSRNALSLLDNLLTWARSQIGRISTNPTMIDLKFITNEIVTQHSISAELKHIEIKIEFDYSYHAYADEDMVRTIIRNLLTNALKFTNTNGKIIIQLYKLENMLYLSLIDNGIGMESEKLNNLFKIEVDNSTPGTANEKGTGLGLILCKDFVEKNGGQIWVESKPDEGSKFTFSIPAEKPDVYTQH